MATDMIVDTIKARSNYVPDDALYEVVDGERIELPPMSTYASMLTTRIAVKIEMSAAGEKGEAFTDMLFDLGLSKNRNRRPDVAYVKYGSWTKGEIPPLKQNAWKIAPTVAIEVVSPSDFVDELMEKIDEYFEAGVESVWVVFPSLKMVHRYSSMNEIAAYGENDMLRDEKMAPGFELPLETIFRKK